MKRCWACREELPVEAFHVDRSRYDGLAALCRKCATLRRREYDNANRDKVNAGHAEYRAKNPEVYKRSNITYTYNLTAEDYRFLLDRSGGCCEMCGRPATKLVVDHDQKCCPDTGSRKRSCGRCVRGLICQNCNLGLGQFGDDLDRLWAAIEYLVRWEMLTAGRPAA